MKFEAGQFRHLLGALAWAAFAISASTVSAQTPGVRIADAKLGDVRLLISNGLRIPFEAVKEQAESVIGRHIVVEYGASRRLTPQIEADQPFELTIMTREVVDEMVAKGKVRPGLTDIARTAVAVAQRGGATGDASAPATLKTLLLGARRIHFTGIGAARPTIDKTFEGLGIADAVRGRLDDSSSSLTTSGPALAAGEYDLVLNLASEMTPTPGWTYLGPIPSQFQVPVVMSAGVGAKGDAVAAKLLISFLQGPAIEGPLKSSRMSR
jgi:molybdate transport system substrate-binding protein